MEGELHAVLVGIERWKSEKLADYPLEGCLNDVALLERTFTAYFGARPENILVLRNETATRDAIVSALRERLVATARRWFEAGRPAPAPAFVFHFSGHGSEANDPTGTQPNGRDQTIVPYDSRTPGVFDLKDWELGQILDELSRYSTNVTVLLDCCHSGSGTRSVARRGRACPADDRKQPFGRPPESSKSVREKKSGTRSASTEVPGTHVLLAACAAHQEAFPYDDDSTGVRQTYGMLSYALGKTLAEPDARSLTYRELHGRIVRLIQAWGSSQTPQCEGDRDRRLFGGELVERDLWWRVVAAHDSGWTVDAGAMHGLSVGDLLDVFPPGSRLRRDAGAARWQLKVTRVAAITSEAILVTPPAGVTHDATPSVGAAVGRVTIPKPTADGAAPALPNSSGVAPSSPGKSPDRFQDPATFALRNPRRSALAGLVACEIHQVVVGAARRPGELESTPIANPVEGDLRIAAGTAVCFQFTNGSAKPLYLHAFYFGYDGSITRIYPKMAGERVAVESGRSVKSSGFRLKFAAAESPQITEVREGVKLFASVMPCDLDSFGKDGGHRALKLEIPDDWTTVERTFLLVR